MRHHLVSYFMTILSFYLLLYLLQELESPFKISGFSANPLIYNIAKLIVLSAFSTVMTELLGFKLKLYKIKLKG